MYTKIKSEILTFLISESYIIYKIPINLFVFGDDFRNT